MAGLWTGQYSFGFHKRRGISLLKKGYAPKSSIEISFLGELYTLTADLIVITIIIAVPQTAATASCLQVTVYDARVMVYLTALSGSSDNVESTGGMIIASTVLEDICDKPIRIQSYCAVARLHGV
jgi:uncharacterized membrane protein